MLLSVFVEGEGEEGAGCKVREGRVLCSESVTLRVAEFHTHTMCVCVCRCVSVCVCACVFECVRVCV